MNRCSIPIATSTTSITSTNTPRVTRRASRTRTLIGTRRLRTGTPTTRTSTTGTITPTDQAPIAVGPEDRPPPRHACVGRFAVLLVHQGHLTVVEWAATAVRPGIGAVQLGHHIVHIERPIRG